MKLYYKSVPFAQDAVTLALESGVDGVIVPRAHMASVQELARCEVLADEDTPSIVLQVKADEEAVAARLCAGEIVALARGWEVIPVENLLAQRVYVMVEVSSLEEAQLASGILEHGVDAIIMLPEAQKELQSIVTACKVTQGHKFLETAVITHVAHAGLGHRVCVDTLSLLHRGQGLLVGNSSAFTFLVHAETEHNTYVAARPFRINAGAVHAYVQLPHDTTCYLEELHAGSEVLIVHADGETQQATVGRVKVEVRPMLLVEAQCDGKIGTVFLQNAETIRLTRPDGSPVSVVSLKPGDEILCSTDTAGRHFGIRVHEAIREY